MVISQDHPSPGSGEWRSRHSDVGGEHSADVDSSPGWPAENPPVSGAVNALRGIIVAASPLGNVGDASPRLAQALATADVVAAEDTRRTARLAHALGVTIRGKLISNFDHNEKDRVSDLLAVARRGSVLVVTDAGMPVVSDPGLSLVAAAHREGAPVSAIPGPSAVTTAVALSGLGVGRFLFDGFAPRRPGVRRTWLAEFEHQPRAVCFFESPHRLAATLADAVEILGAQRQAAVCREMTKLHEEVRRGSLEELAEWAREGVRGEITVVIDGARGARDDKTLEELAADVEQRASTGQKLRAACKEVAREHGVSARDLYQEVLSRRG